MFLTVAIQYLAARAVDFWKGRRRKYWYSQFIDPIVYSLPLPCAVLGMFLFPAVSDSSVTQSLVVGIMAIYELFSYIERHPNTWAHQDKESGA